MCNSLRIVPVLIVCLHLFKADCFQVITAYKCIPSKDKFVKLTDVSLIECVNACVRRHTCKSVGYRRQMNFCELHTEDILALDTTEDGSCIFIERNDMDITDTNKCNCTHIGHVCNPTSGQCEIEECGELYLPNGKVYGNSHHIGAKRGVSCNHEYIERAGIKQVICNSSGEWNPTPTCDLIGVATPLPSATSETAAPVPVAGETSTVATTSAAIVPTTNTTTTSTSPENSDTSTTELSTNPPTSTNSAGGNSFTTSSTFDTASESTELPTPKPDPALGETNATTTSTETETTPNTTTASPSPENSNTSTTDLSKVYYCPISTQEKPDYSMFDLHKDGIRVENRTSILFATKGKNDAHVLLQNDRNNYTNNVVEIVLGGWSNTKSVIRNKPQGTDLTEYMGTVLDPYLYKPFWISWINGCIQVGNGSIVGVNEIMKICGVDYNITGMRISYGHGSDGNFKFDFLPSVTYRGCYFHDLLNNLFVDVLAFINDTLTTTMCYNHCKSIGMRFFLTQSGSSCYCGHAFNDQRPSSECWIQCAGNPSEICGGRYSASVYDTLDIMCRDGWLTYGYSCYYFSTGLRTWQDAQMECEKLGSTLVEIEDSSENSFLVKNARTLNDFNFWIGLKKQNSTGQFVWTGSKTPLNSFNDWAPGNPDNAYGNEECTHIPKPMEYKWNDVYCSNLYHFVCEKQEV